MFHHEPKEIDSEQAAQILHWYLAQPHGRPWCLMSDEYKEKTMEALERVFGEIKMSDFVSMKIGNYGDVPEVEREKTLKILGVLPTCDK